ncbi:arylesterase [Mucilaginibacter sp.]
MHKYLSALTIALLLAACNSTPQNTTADTTQSASATPASTDSSKIVLVFGDSLTAGYGLDDPDNEAYPAVLQQKIDSAKLPYHVVNAGVSGETSAGGKGRIDWALKQKVDVFVLALGSNDGLRGIPTAETTRNLQAILDRVKAKYPNAKRMLLGMQVPPSMGTAYTASFKGIFPQLAAKNQLPLVPFLLQGVGGVPRLNQADGIHPTAEGAKILAGNVWPVLRKEL